MYILVFLTIWKCKISCQSISVTSFFFFLFLFIYFQLHWVFITLRWCSLVTVNWGFSLQWIIFLQSLGFQGVRASVVVVWAQLPEEMWKLPGPGIEPMSPALAGEFLTTGPRDESTCGFVLQQGFKNLGVRKWWAMDMFLGAL